MRLAIFILLFSGVFCAVARAAVTTGSASANHLQAETSRGEDASARAFVDQSLLGYDFTQDIDTQVVIDVRHASELVDALIGVCALGAISHHPQDESILGVKIVRDHRWTTTNTMFWVARYLSRNGVLPNNGAELFPELATDQGRQDFFDMYFTERMQKYGYGVNIVTGRFYDNLQDPSWRPGGIYIELVEQDEAGNFLHNGYPMDLGEDDMVNPKAIYYKVFSAQEGEVLYEDYGVVSCRTE